MVFNILIKDSMGNIVTDGQIHVGWDPVMQNKRVAEALEKASKYIAEGKGNTPFRTIASVTISIA